MIDLNFDIVARDLVMSDNDFAETSLPDTQNGGIIQYSRCAFLSNPILGVGMEELINTNNGGKVAKEMNRWQAQCIQDGALTAKWSPVNSITGPVNNITITANISYE